jgi:tetrathionate reductase subunit B
MATKTRSGVDRRGFLKVGASTLLAAKAGSAAAPAHASERPVRHGMVIDLRKCFGCHACSIACKAEQDVPLGYFKSWVFQADAGLFPNVARHFIPSLCNHCEDPPCVDGCPTGATWQRDDGIVIQDEDTCIGCKYCIQACPYDVKYVDPRSKTAQKCDFCVHLVDQGLQPACVNTCNARARIFGDLNDPQSEVSKLIVKHKAQPLRPYMGTEPRVYYIGLQPEVYEKALRARQASAATGD